MLYYHILFGASMDIHLVQTTVSNGSFSTVWISMEDPGEMRCHSTTSGSHSFHKSDNPCIRLRYCRYHPEDCKELAPIERMKRNASSAAVAAPSAPRRRQPQISCDFCRSKKLKCDRGRPCLNCSVRKVPCDGPPKEFNIGVYQQ